MKKRQIIIKAKELFDGENKQRNKFVVVEEDKIIDVISGRLVADYEGFVTPAFIDAHSHIGMCREGEPASEEESNETLNQICPLNNPLDSIYFDDRAMKDAVDFGVLYSCVVPGSGNLIGGRAMIIKNCAENRSEAVVKDYGYKMALGFNPRSTTEWKGERPHTRMGIYSLLEKTFDNLLIKKEKTNLQKMREMREINQKRSKGEIDDNEVESQTALIEDLRKLEFSAEENALLEILSGRKTCKVHVHKEDDILYLIRLKNKYGLKVTADHACDVFHREIFDKLAENDIPVVYGPWEGFSCKVELKHAFYQNVLCLMLSRAFCGLMSDHPVVLARSLKETLRYFLIQGMSEEEAISLITYKNAKILGIDDILGTIEPDKLASLIIWDKHPLYLGSFPKLVMAEGKILRERR
jgi:imidazolonepropionase-like amidohydrolase